MKKLLLLIVAILALTNISNAQNIGATLGANVANVAGDGIDQIDSKFNFTAGLFAEFMLSDKIGLQPELVLSGQGYKFILDDDGAGLYVGLKQKLTYVNLPVLFNYYIADNFYLQAGPYLGILTNAEEDIIGSFGLFGGKNKDEFNSTDFGAIIGAGFKVNKITIGLKYQLGLSDIASVKYQLELSDIASDTNVKNNRVVNISVGYRFVEK